MFDAKAMSKAIRAKKKNLLKPDMDYAGQEAMDPDTADEIKQNLRVSEILGDPDHEPASETEMGEHESSQEVAVLKKLMAKVARYFEEL